MAERMKTCLQCKADFPARGPKLYCSAACRRTFQYNRKFLVCSRCEGPREKNLRWCAACKIEMCHRICERCGVEFQVHRPAWKQSFCTQTCANNRTVTKVCKCGKVFRTKLSARSTCGSCAAANRRLRKVLRRGGAGPTHTDKDWRRLLARYDGKCAYCLERPAEHRDHIIPISRGGTDAIGNIVPACGSCNSSKYDRLPIEFRHARAS